MESTKVRFGILGTASIARKNSRAIMNAANAELVAVASRSADRVQTWAQDNCLAPSVRLYASYDQLLNDPAVQAVYLPLPTKLHLEWGIKCANAKKHLLIEKPVACNAEELRQIVAACWRNGVIFMDGVMMMHHPRLELLRAALRDPLAGDVRRVEAALSFDGRGGFMQNDIRTKASGDPLGALGDLGWYTVRLGLLAASQGRDREGGTSSSGGGSGSGGGIVMPKRCSARCSLWSDGGVVPLEVEAVCYFESGATLHFSNSFMLPWRQRFEIASTSRRSAVASKVLACDDFVIPRSRTQASFTMESAATPSDVDTAVSSIIDVFTADTSHAQQEVRMVEEFCRIALELDTKLAAVPLPGPTRGGAAPAPPAAAVGVAQDVKYWADIALATQLVVDACMLSMSKGGEEVPVGDLRL
jgi:hypothetical protein